MINKIRSLKIKDVLLLIFGIVFLYITMVIGGEEPDNARELVSQQEPWLKQTSSFISDYMNDNRMTVSTTSAGLNFVSSFFSTNFSLSKLEALKVKLVNTGWRQLPKQTYIDYNKEMVGTLIGQPLTDAVVLCKNNAAIVIWMVDLKGRYKHTSEISTNIELLYDSRTPCFNLRSKNNEN